MNGEELLNLYEKFLNGQCSDAEKAHLESHMDDIKLSTEVWEDTEAEKHNAYQRIWGKLSESLPSQQNPVKIYPSGWIKMAALLFIASSVALIFIKTSKHPEPIAQLAIRHSRKIMPGGNKAVLTLSNGSTIVLNDARNGKLTTQSGTQVVKAKDGMLVYRTAEHHSAWATEMNTVSTPRGGQYQLLLADGTKVWLNAASSLKFPAAFTGKERRVELSGEAYFEVSKNPAKPFIVHSSQQEVLVLGTHFNIKAYEEEGMVRTSLLEGKVNISAHGELASLVAGQEAVQKTNGDIRVKEADVAQSISWKNGLFQFNNASIEEVMLQLSRWYDVEVSYEGKPPVKQFTGTISRQVGMKEILSMLSYTGVRFNVKNNQILVKQ